MRMNTSFSLILIFFLLLPGPVASSSGVKDKIKAATTAAKRGDFAGAYVAVRELSVTGLFDFEDVKRLRELLLRYPGIFVAGESSLTQSIEEIRTEEQLNQAWAEVHFLSILAGQNVLPFERISRIQGRLRVVASQLVLNGAINLNYSSRSVGCLRVGDSYAQPDVERRVVLNTLTDGNTRPLTSPEYDFIFDYLIRTPEARRDALPEIQKIPWSKPQLTGKLQDVYPEVAEKQLNKKGVLRISVETTPNSLRDGLKRYLEVFDDIAIVKDGGMAQVEVSEQSFSFLDKWDRGEPAEAVFDYGIKVILSDGSLQLQDRFYGKKEFAISWSTPRAVRVLLWPLPVNRDVDVRPSEGDARAKILPELAERIAGLVRRPR